MKVYTVIWSSACQDDDGNSKAFAGVHGVYAFEADAKKGLEECKNEIYREITENPDYDEETIAEVMATTFVYGSVDDDSFGINYTLGDTPCEIYICMQIKELQE
jgi:hypothetical protein